MMSPLDPAIVQAMSTECACFNLRRTTRAITQFYDQVLAPSGLRATQATLLVALARTGAIPAARLTRILGMEKTTLSRNLAPLRSARYVASRPGADRRVKLIALTPRGEAALARALPLWEEAQRKVTVGIGAESWQAIRRDLGRLTTLATDTPS